MKSRKLQCLIEFQTMQTQNSAIMRNTEKQDTNEIKHLSSKEKDEIARRYEESQPSRPTPAWWANATTWWVAGIITILAMFFIIWIWN